MNVKFFGEVKLNNEVLDIKEMSLSFNGPIQRPSGEVLYYFHIDFTIKNHCSLARVEKYGFSHYSNVNFFSGFSRECEITKIFEAYTDLHHDIGDSRESYETNSFKSDFMRMSISPSKNIVNISIDCDLMGNRGKFIDKPLNLSLTFNLSKKEFEGISNAK